MSDTETRSDERGAPDQPVILVVDDDEEALGRVERELRRRCGADYHVVATTDPDEALGLLDALDPGDAAVALVLADQWMPGVDGTEFLARAAQRYPRAKRGLLVEFGSWGDEPTARAILRAMAVGVIDYYVLKPWRSPDEFFNRTIAEFLHEWARMRPSGPREVVVVGPDIERTHEMRSLLSRNAIPHVGLDEHEPEGRALLARAGVGDRPVPVVGFHDGRFLVDPSNVEIAEAFGFTTRLRKSAFDVVILGGGPAGLAAGVYAASEGLETLIIEREAIGGQAGSSSLIRNYLGFSRGVSGAELAMRAYQQAWVFGASVLMMREATWIASEGSTLAVSIPGETTVHANAVVLAMGVSYRRLGVPELESLTGAGVFYGASIAEAQALEGEDVYVLGGGNSAGQAAMHLSRYARQVTIVVRGSSLASSMSDYLIQQIGAAPNIDVRFGWEVVGGGGEGRLETLVLGRRDGDERVTVPAAGLFVLIGAHPHTDWLPPEIERDDWGFVVTGVMSGESGSGGHAGTSFETTMPGVFAAGDVRHGSMKRVGAAVGEGAGVIQEVYRHINGSP